MPRANSRLWSPFANLPSDRMNTVTIVKGEGQFVFDSEGRRYLDGIAGLWYTHIGHGHQKMVAEVAKQMATLEAFQTHSVFDNRPALELADALAARFPLDDPLTFFSSGGGDAIETACKLAREYWRIQGVHGKNVLISRRNSYHGMQGFGSGLAGLDSLRTGHEDGYPSVRVEHDDVDALELLLGEVGPEKVAAFVFEPVIGAGGIIPPPDGYLAKAQEICRQNNVLLICDEVITGFGRLGTWSGSEYYELHPDIITLAKGITSGYVPLGAAMASREVWEAFETRGVTFRHGYTYSGHPTACAAAIANLSILEEEDLLRRATQMGSVMSAHLRSLTHNPVIAEIRQVGLMAGIGLDHGGTGAALAEQGVDLGSVMVSKCLERGLILRRMFQGDLQVSPPLIIHEEDIETIVVTIADAADSVLTSYGL